MGPEPTLERAFRGHRGGVAGLAFNPNMRQLVSAGLDGDVLVWNFKPSLRAYRFAGHTARGARRRGGSVGMNVMRVRAGAQGGALSGHARHAPGERALGGVLRGERADRLRLQGPHRAAVAAHRVRARRRGASLSRALRRRARSDGRSSVLKAHAGGVRAVAFSPDGRLLLSASDDKTVKARADTPRQSSGSVAAR